MKRTKTLLKFDTRFGRLDGAYVAMSALTEEVNDKFNYRYITNRRVSSRPAASS